MDTLLETKFYIPVPGTNLVSRERLLRVIEEGIKGGKRLTLISAPPGYGKTTLLGEWIFEKNLSVAWLTLDEGENDPARFVAYLISAIRRIEPGIGETTLAMLGTPAKHTPESLLTPLVNEISKNPEGLLIVLDDYHTIHNQVIHDELAFLLDHIPPQIHVVIASRADPLLPLARLRGRGQVTELRQNDLQFNVDEARMFLEKVLGVEISRKDIESLTSLTEGWAAGLQMATASMKDHEDITAFIKSFTGSNRYILDYLIEEVLQGQPEPIQGFLLHTSILEQLSGPLCDSVIDGSIALPTTSQSILEGLEHANLFIIPLDDRREWYRYHRLFADLLRQRLYQSHPDILDSLHSRASVWYEKHGLLEEAIEHAISSGDGARAADLVERSAEAVLMRSQVATFMGWIDQLPEGEVHRRPALSAYYAWVLLWSGAPIEAIEAHLKITALGEDYSAKALPFRAFMASIKSDFSSAIDLSTRALEQLPEDDQLLRNLANFILATAYMADGEILKGVDILEEIAIVSQRSGNMMIATLVLCELGELRIKQGRLHQANALYQQALNLATNAQGDKLPVAGKALIGLGDIAREWNDLEAAQRYLKEGIELAKQWSIIGTFEGYLNLIQLHDALGAIEKGDELFAQLRDLAIQFDATEIDDYIVEMYEARRSIALGDLDSARLWAERRSLPNKPPEIKTGDALDYIRTRMWKYEANALAWLHIMDGHYLEALNLLELVQQQAEEADRMFLTIESAILKAIALQSIGEREQAISSMMDALNMAEPEGFMRTFVDLGDKVKDLLEMARNEAENAAMLDYIDSLLKAFKPPVIERQSISSIQPKRVGEKLSKRELDVLHLLPSSLSSTDMAAELSISVNTLRTHLKNIYAKLDAHSRYEAIERAKKIGLL